MLRIVVAEAGSGHHVHEVDVVVRALRDAGHEVVHTGSRQTPEQVVQTALQEDADLIGLALPEGGQGVAPLRRLLELLEQRDAGDIGVFAAAVETDEDLAALADLEVAGAFTRGVTPAEIAGWAAERESG